jgi:DNA polymerase-3 subunit gamma/tau
MSYLVLARKWRPQTFDQVVGQGTVTRTLKNALTTGRVGHAFLLSGARGVGKTTTARILAKALNCAKSDGPTGEPCGECAPCREIGAGTCLDVQEIDGATHNGVEQVRELRESARYNPARDRFKVWIIDEVHMLSTGAFNALLKTLEEPPPRVKFIFATTEYHKIPDTILSRCQQYDFRLIPARELLAHLKDVAAGEGIAVSDEALARIARAAEGSARDALSLFDQVLSFSGREVRDEDVSALLGLIDRELLLGATQAVAGGDSLALLELVERLSDYGADYRNYARELLLHLRELLLVKVAPEGSRLLAQVVPEERAALQPLAQAFSEEDLLRMIDVLADAEQDLRLAQDPRVTLELALLKMVQMRRLLPFAELVERVERLDAGAPAPARTADPAPARTAAPAAAPGPAPATRPSAAEPPRDERRAGAPGGNGATAAPAAPVSGAAEILAAMGAQGRTSLGQALRGTHAREEGGTLVLEVPADWFGFAQTHQDEYEALARTVAGRPLKVRVVAAAPAEPDPPSESEQKKQRMVQEATSDHAVQEALDLFRGRVVDVREARSREQAGGGS